MSMNYLVAPLLPAVVICGLGGDLLLLLLLPLVVQVHPHWHLPASPVLPGPNRDEGLEATPVLRTLLLPELSK